MNNSNKTRAFRSVSLCLLVIAMVVAPGLGNPSFVKYFTVGQAYGQTVTTTYEYDNNGNMLSRTTGGNIDNFTYDVENRLVSANMQTGANPGLVTYSYDDQGLRTSSTFASTTTSFILDKNRDNAQVVIERTGSSFVNYTHGHRLISQSRTGLGSRFYLSDGQLSTRQLVSQTGLLTDSYTYDAFGELLASTGTTLNNYRYTGEQLDPNSNFYYFRARYYDQATGRFNATDPFVGRITTPLSLHRYLYADADPVNKIDPSGELPILVPIVIGVLTVIGLVSFGQSIAGAFKSFAKTHAEGRTNRFFYKSCGTWQAGFIAITGGGSAVIAEQPNASLKDPPAQGRKYGLSFRGASVGGELSGELEQAEVPFSSYKDKLRLLDHFIGEGFLTNIVEAKAVVGGALFSNLILPEQSVVPQVLSLNINKPKSLRFGVEASLGSGLGVHLVGQDTSPGYITQNGVSCTIPPESKK